MMLLEIFVVGVKFGRPHDILLSRCFGYGAILLQYWDMLSIVMHIVMFFFTLIIEVNFNKWCLWVYYFAVSRTSPTQFFFFLSEVDVILVGRSCQTKDTVMGNIVIFLWTKSEKKQIQTHQ